MAIMGLVGFSGPTQITDFMLPKSVATKALFFFDHRVSASREAVPSIVKEEMQ